MGGEETRAYSRKNYNVRRTLCAFGRDRTDNAMCRLQRIAAEDTVVVRHVCMVIIIRFGVWRDGGVLKKNKPFPAERFYAARARVRTIGRVASANESTDLLKQKIMYFVSPCFVFFFYIDTRNRLLRVPETPLENNFGVPLSVLAGIHSYYKERRKNKGILVFSQGTF